MTWDSAEKPTIEVMRARLALYEAEVAALAHEIISSLTPAWRRQGALIDRAATQSKALHLLRELESLGTN